MTSDHDNPDCASVSGLIQPYVDAELADRDKESVLNHLERCDSCRTTVQQQQRVRAALRDLEQDVAPQVLRDRILAELDKIDAEQPAANQGWLAASFGRISSFMRGGMLLAPAAAAAVALFFVVRANVESDGLATQGTSLIHSDTQSAAPPETEQVAEKTEPALAAPVGSAFQMQFASPSSLPDGIQLVGAGNADASRGTVRLRDGESAFVDLQRPSSHVHPSGKEQVFRGRSYYLTRDQQGRPVVQFQVGGVLHQLSLDGPGRLGAPVHFDEADIRQVVHLADRLQSGPTR
jgi:anti-sigma factor (TIGR02949 family)